MPYALRENPTVAELVEADQQPALAAKSARFNLTLVAAVLAIIGMTSAVTWAVLRTNPSWSKGVFTFVVIGPLASVLAFAISTFAPPRRVSCATRKWLVPLAVLAVCLSSWATYGFVLRMMERW